MRRTGIVILALVVGGLQSGCVTVAEFRKLEREVLRLKQQAGPVAPERAALADLGTDLDAIQAQLADLEGRLEVVEHQAVQAVREAQAARLEAAGKPVPPEPAPDAVAPEEAAGGDPESPQEPAAPAASVSQEVSDYRAAYASWRNDDVDQCIDRFRTFLQTYASSTYADDAAFWMADCYFKQGDYKTSILRFDDVVTRYPGGNKASEALYRQGEALLRLGPAYAKAASKAFERVIQEYPDSPRAKEAKRQLELLGPG